jgi:hypothetical protein
MPHNDPEVSFLDDEVFPNIKWSVLHMVASKTPVLPHIETIEWLINHTNFNKWLVIDREGKCIGVFLSMEVNKYYKLSEPKVRLNADFMVNFYELHNTSQILSS